MKNVLYASGHSRSAFKWGMVGEIAKRLLDEPSNNVFYMDCNNNVKGPCGLNAHKHLGYCNKCLNNCRKVIELAGIKNENILKMEKIKPVKFPDFNSIKEAIDYNFDGYNLGLGPISCIMTLNRDYDFNIKKWNSKIKKFFETEYTILKNIEKFHKIYNFEEIHIFNGRMASMYPYVAFAKKHNIPYFTYETGANIHKFIIIENSVPHDFYSTKQRIKDYWQNGSDDKCFLAEKWFKDRRQGKYQAMESFTKDQTKNLLPKGFDKTKENIAFYNSSIDEIYAFDSWKHPWADNENQIIDKILEHYKNDSSKHFYLRIHPNLKKAKIKHSTQIRQIEELNKKYKNLTVIEPEDKIDTYALTEAVDKVITAYSSVGFEATYWGNVSIFLGKAIYEDLDCSYCASSFEELCKLIDNKDLKPKPKENTYPMAYLNEVQGIEYKYYKPISKCEGEFMGLHLKGR